MQHSVEEAYRILEVTPSASWEEVRQSYREMVKVWHPDRFHDDEKFKARATRKVQDINNAYKVLEFHYQTPKQAPPPIPRPEPAPPKPEPTKAPQADEHHYWSNSADGLIAQVTGGQPYQVFPCKLHGFDRYRQHLEVIPLYIFMAGCICLFSGIVIHPFLWLPFC